MKKFLNLNDMNAITDEDVTFLSEEEFKQTDEWKELYRLMTPEIWEIYRNKKKIYTEKIEKNLLLKRIN